MEVKVYKCSNCGAGVRKGSDKFCGNCGSKLNFEDNVTRTTRVVKVDQTKIYMQEKKDKRLEKMTKIFRKVIIGLIITILAMLGILMFSSNDILLYTALIVLVLSAFGIIWIIVEFLYYINNS